MICRDCEGVSLQKSLQGQRSTTIENIVKRRSGGHARDLRCLSDQNAIPPERAQQFHALIGSILPCQATSIGCPLHYAMNQSWAIGPAKRTPVVAGPHQRHPPP